MRAHESFPSRWFKPGVLYEEWKPFSESKDLICEIPLFSLVTIDRGRSLNIKTFIFIHRLHSKAGLVCTKLKTVMRVYHCLLVIFHLYYYLFAGIDFQTKRCVFGLGKAWDRIGAPGQICACFVPLVSDLIRVTCSLNRHWTYTRTPGEIRAKTESSPCTSTIEMQYEEIIWQQTLAYH